MSECNCDALADALADTVAAVEAIRSDDTQGAGVLLRHGDHSLMLITALKLLASAADEYPFTPAAQFRHWASHAVERS